MAADGEEDVETVTGVALLADALRSQGVEWVFGVVGIPVTNIAPALQDAGIGYIGMRNEQAASYAASVVGYLTGRPLLVVAGGCDQDQIGMGAFQEWPQLEDCSRCKYAVRLETLESIPFHVEKAVRSSLYGRPGPSYIEIPGNMTSDAVPITRIEQVLPCPPPPMSLADPAAVQRAVSLLRSAQRPLVIVGKGVAYAFAEHEARSLIVPRRLPFLPTPMGKGVLSDAHPLCVSPARSRALQEADVILLLGARLNWILHFGLPPRFSRDVKIIQVEICPEEFSNNVPAHLMLHGHLKPVLKQLVEEFGQWVMDRDGQWWSRLKEKIHINMNINKELASVTSLPMNFYAAYDIMKDYIPRNAVLVNEGSATMDIGRTVFLSHFPRRRLDAGSFGTMGLGCGYAIAAALIEQRKPDGQRSPVVAIQGDSAFGFSGMELETASRYQLPIVFVVMNNSGIYRGVDSETWTELNEEPELPLSLPPQVCYQEQLTTILARRSWEKEY
ncbi:2-hydroxyacyl-CoA lyase 1 [Geodia barretti]|uniref:2-hydroxyacyl-CoA lyase n=1 Tax=Geodia barretti TaxID=519541 RepID=A0AA35QR70_GEOBA|nr:2-hydroxyacyl-CoA lyase 1 [Geodia barretti]